MLLYCDSTDDRREEGEELRLYLDHTLPKRSLFEIFDRTNQSLILLHSTSVSFARASDSEAELCLLPLIFGGGIVDSGVIDEVDGIRYIVGNDVALPTSFKILIIWCRFGLHWRLSNPLPS